MNLNFEKWKTEVTEIADGAGISLAKADEQLFEYLYRRDEEPANAVKRIADTMVRMYCIKKTNGIFGITPELSELPETPINLAEGKGHVYTRFNEEDRTVISLPGAYLLFEESEAVKLAIRIMNHYYTDYRDSNKPVKALTETNTNAIPITGSEARLKVIDALNLSCADMPLQDYKDVLDTVIDDLTMYRDAAEAD